MYEQKKGESASAYYRRLSKVADQRLVRLEQHSITEQYKAVTRYSYASAQRSIQAVFGTSENGKPGRFNRKIQNEKDLDKMTSAVLKFLNSATSSIGDIRQNGRVIQTGITTMYKQRADTINRKYGTTFTWDNLATYYEKAQSKIASKFKGSSTELKIIATIQKNANLLNKIDVNNIKSNDLNIIKSKIKHVDVDDLQNRLEKAEQEDNKELINDIQSTISNHLQLSDDNVINDMTIQALTQLGLKLSDIM